MYIAILQRDPIQRDAIETAVTQGGHRCIAFEDGLDLCRALVRSTFDLIVLDWHGTSLSGDNVLRAVRSVGGDRIPVMFASADGSEGSIVRAFEAGVDGYVTLPLRAAEFSARINALLRRAYVDAHDRTGLSVGPYRFDAILRQVSVHGEPVQLSGTQFRLASLFFFNIGRELSRDHIFAMVWGSEFRDLTRTIDSQVSRLRGLLAIEPQNGFQLQPVYRCGYRLMQLSEGKVDTDGAGSGSGALRVASGRAP